MTRWQLLLLGVLSSSAGCGGNERAQAAGGPPVPAGEAGGSSVTTGEGSGGIGNSSHAGEGNVSSATPGSLQIVNVEDEPGSTTSVAPSVFLEPEPLQLVFDRAGMVGNRRFAFDSASLALMTFAADGSAASPIIYRDLGAAVGFNEQVATLELGASGQLVLEAYDELGEPLAGSVELDTAGTGSHALAASPSALLALWSNDGRLKGQLATPERALGEQFDFGSLSCGEYACLPFALWNGERFVVSWSRVQHDKTSVIARAAVDAEGRVVSARNVVASEESYELAGAAPLANGRAALLLREGYPAGVPVLAFVDAFGALEPTLLRFLGVSDAWDIASNDGELAIVARSTRAQAVFRALSSSGAPSGGWLVIDDSGTDTAFSARAAIFAHAEGYGAVVRQTDGSSGYLELDRTGL